MKTFFSTSYDVVVALLLVVGTVFHTVLTPVSWIGGWGIKMIGMVIFLFLRPRVMMVAFTITLMAAMWTVMQFLVPLGLNFFL